MNIASTYQIPVIEDAAEALGSKYNKQPLGSFGLISALSFNGNKIITTSGGGAFLSNDESLVKKARFLSTQARENAPHYQQNEIGYNYRLSNVIAGIGRGQMEVINDRVNKKREIYQGYWRNFAHVDGIRFLEEPGKEFFSNRWLTTLLIDPEKTGISREQIQDKLAAQNIETRPLWKPMHLQPVFSGYDAFRSGVSDELFRIGLCLPSGTNMSDEEFDMVVRSLRKCIHISN